MEFSLCTEEVRRERESLGPTIKHDGGSVCLTGIGFISHNNDDPKYSANAVTVYLDSKTQKDHDQSWIGLPRTQTSENRIKRQPTSAEEL